MPLRKDVDSTQARLEQLNAALEEGSFHALKHTLHGLSAPDVAHLLESSPPQSRQVLWELIDEDDEGDVLGELGDEIQSQLLRTMNAEEVAAATSAMDVDDAADLLQQLPARALHKVLNSMTLQDRARVEQVLTYPDDTAGGLMNTDTITVRPPHTMDVVLRYLRRHNELPRMTDNLIVVNRSDRFIGLLPLSTLLVSDPSATVREMMHTRVEAIPATMPDKEVASLFERHDLVSAPVVDTEGKLLGRITIDDVVDVIREDADHSLMSMAGLGEDEDTFAPIMMTAPRRAIWLGINLLTAFLASAVINMFQDTIDKVVALAVLMPIVASMGGVAGTQTLTVMVRGLALNQIGHSNRSWLLNREVVVGFMNGILWSAVVAVAASLWFQDTQIGMIIAAAMVINLVVAALAGTLIPLTLQRLDVDPALAGSVVLTTVTDVTGFLSFLGLATLFYA